MTETQMIKEEIQKFNFNKIETLDHQRTLSRN